MRVFRINAHSARRSDDRDNVKVVMSRAGFVQLARDLVALLGLNPGPADEMLYIELFGSLEQYHQEWRPAERATACASPSAEDADE